MIFGAGKSLASVLLALGAAGISAVTLGLGSDNAGLGVGAILLASTVSGVAGTGLAACVTSGAFERLVESVNVSAPAASKATAAPAARSVRVRDDVFGRIVAVKGAREST